MFPDGKSAALLISIDLDIEIAFIYYIKEKIQK